MRFQSRTPLRCRVRELSRKHGSSKGLFVSRVGFGPPKVYKLRLIYYVHRNTLLKCCLYRVNLSFPLDDIATIC